MISNTNAKRNNFNFKDLGKSGDKKMFDFEQAVLNAGREMNSNEQALIASKEQSQSRRDKSQDF